MIFFPKKIYDNAGEDAVWEELKKSLKGVDGFALNKANLYFEGKSWFQPDIIVVSPYTGITIVEVKGCRIDDVEQVTLGTWSMNKSFYADEINPFDQVQKQRYRLIDILKSKGINLPANAVKHCVALPFISRKEWQDKGFANEYNDKLIRFSDKKESIAISQGQPKISPALWLDICNAFGVKPMQNFDYEKKNQGLLEKPKSASSKGKLVCVQYKGYAPSKDMTMEFLGEEFGAGQINDSCTYLVATAGLERLRGRENPGAAEQKGNLLFDKVIEKMMNKRMLTKADTVILLRRIINAEFVDDEPRRQQLNTDVYDLYNKILELDSAEFDLSNRHSREKAALSCTSAASFEEFAKLKELLIQALSEQDAHDVIGTSNQAILDWLKNEYVPHPTIIMEGFTRLTPIQKLYVDHCLGFGCTVVFLYSYDEKQKWGFSNQDHIVSAFKDVTVETLQYHDQPLELVNDLNALKGNLFDLQTITDNKRKLREDDHRYSSEDGSVTATEYNFISQEIEDVCAKIKSLLMQTSTGKKKIAIVTRDLGTYAPQFISKIQNDAYLNQYLDLPQRKLLQTPFGRFILSLYKIWDHENERLVVDCNAFSELIASGWLGQALRETLADFEFIKPLFSKSQTIQQWEHVLTRTYNVNDEDNSRFPLASLKHRDVLFKQWLGTLKHLDTVCARLFSKELGNHDIAQHISLLGEELDRFLEENPFSGTEAKLLKQLKGVFNDLEKTESITLSYQEFGLIINGMATTAEQMIDEYDRNWSQDKTQIKIVMPESIDGLMTNGPDGYDIIYYVGADNQRLPKKSSHDWLFDSKELLGDLEVNDSNKFERYLFLSVFRSAKEQFHLSFSRYDGSQNNDKSIYYTLLAKRLAVTEHQKSADSNQTSWNWSATANVRAVDEVKSVSVAEMMVYTLCPYRYLLEKVSSRPGCYKTEWQLTLYSGSQWKQGILFAAAMSGEAITEEMLTGLKDNVWQSAIAPYYPYISDLEADTRESYLQLSKLAQYSAVTFDKRYKVKSLGEGFTLQLPTGQLFWGENTISDNSNDFLQTVVSNELLLPVAKDSDDANDAHQTQAQKVFFDIHRQIKNKMNQKEQTSFIESIREMSRRSFVKQSGNHCNYCPSNKLCLSMSTEENSNAK
ncbi:nuclease-related domain-containing protein [Vibrio alginolyticus]|uniref:nuclease-related domain-containing protein n=1 Tax=Vibrio alginolyticus TaxID=663 RepID=UPI00215F6070|nr:nuclease-related domain-containing protein [Vibrio alginolyticus]MCS0173692.1 NERD domain-containing protein [Vibrio alginolyticus]